MNFHVGRRVASVLALVVSLAGAVTATTSCGPPGGVTLVYTGTKVEDRFGAPSERQKVAQRQLDALVGHEVSIEVDEALASRWSPDGFAHVEEAVLGVARELGKLKEYRPKAFARFAPKVRRVLYTYTAISELSEATFRDDGALLHIQVADSEGRCACSAIERAFVDADRKASEAALRAMRPESVPDADVDDYLRVVGVPESKEKLIAARGDDDRVAFERLVQIHRRLQGPVDGSAAAIKARDEARATTSRAIARVGSELAEAHERNSSAVDKLPKDAPFHRLEASFTRFLVDAGWSLDEYERTAIYKVVFRTARDPHVFPALDRLALAKMLLDRWVRAGAPVHDPEARDRKQSPDERTFDAILCPAAKDANGVPRHDPPGCSSWNNDTMYAWLRDDPSRLESFVAEVVSKKDPKVAEALFHSLTGSASNAVSVWRRFESDEAQWMTLGRAVAAMSVGQMDEAVFEETARAWRQFPRRRPIAMLVFATMDSYSHGFLEGRLKAIAREGQTANERDFAAFLDLGPVAFRQVGVVWPLLARGFSRANVIGPRLGKLVGDKSSRGLDAARNRLCEERAVGEILALATALDRYVLDHPGDEPAFRSTLTALREETCRR